LLYTKFINVNGMLWKTSPSATELEEVVLTWLRNMLGLPKDFFGMVCDTASISSFLALAASREKFVELKIREKGLSGRNIPILRVYTSEEAHSSIDKAVIALGIGHENLIKIPTDEEFRMIPHLLDNAIQKDIKKGYLPIAVIATIGTTSSTSIDPVDEVADICEKYNLWLHIDAAYGGAAAILPEMRWILKGVERADSFVVNPHKWIFTPIDFSAFYFKRKDIMRRAFSLTPEYLRTKEDEVTNFMDYNLQLGRRFRALKFYFVLRRYGVKGIEERIRNHIKLAKIFAKWVDESNYFERMAPVPFSTVCFRANPGWKDEEKLENLNKELMERVNSTGRLFISHTKLKGKFTLRLAIGNIRTEKKHVEEAWNILNEKLREVLEKLNYKIGDCFL